MNQQDQNGLSTSLHAQPQKLYDNEIEEAVLTGLISDSKNRLNYLNELCSEDFFDQKNKSIFDAVSSLAKKEDRIDILSIRKSTGLKFNDVSKIVEKYFDIYSIKSHIQSLKDLSDLRFLVSKLSIANKTTADDARKKMTEVATSIISRVRDNEKEVADIKSLTNEFEEEQRINIEAVKNGGLIGFSSGYKSIDEAVSGIRSPLYYVIKAKTSVGKSALALNIVSKALNQGKRVLLFSLEMSKFQNISRIIGIRTGLDPLEIEKGTYACDERELEAKAELFEQDLTIYEMKRTVEDIIMTAHAENSTKKVDLVVVDYVQNISIQDTRYEAYTKASGEFQNLCSELKVPVLAVSQESSEGNAKGSGDIDAHANFTIRLEKTDDLGTAAGERLMSITKNRHGMINHNIKVRFQPGGKIVED